MRNFCLLLVSTVVVFSVSLGVSSTVYAGAYIYLIPCQTQELQIYFNYVPVEQEQQNQLSSEAYLGQGIATYMQNVPQHKLVSSI
jgi:hypothetical protein